MQTSLHSSLHAADEHPMTEQVQGLIRQALARFAPRVLRVDAHLSDADGSARAGPDAMHCTLQAQLIGTDTVVVKSQAGNAHAAIADAVHKLKRAVGTAIARQDPRNQHAAQAQGAAWQQELI
jgi:hypothetical protein